MRKRIGIEVFLKWAYRDELPKQQRDGGDLTSMAPAGYGSGMGGVIAMAEVGALVDFARENQWGVIPDRYARDDPHPDAIRAAMAMAGLDAWAVSLPDDWNPIADLGAVGEIGRRDSAAAALGRAKVAEALADLTRLDAEGNRTLKGGLRRLVMRFAVLGGAPGWEIEPPEIRDVCVGKGRPAWFRRETIQGADGPCEIEVDGFDRRRRMPFPDAYRKQVLVPDPLEGIIDRGQHEVYVAALGILHAALVDKLEAFALEPPARPARPWEAEGAARPRLLLAKPLPALQDRADDTPMPETAHIAPTGHRVALGPARREKYPVVSVRPA